VRYDSAEDTGEVTSGGGNTELLDLVVRHRRGKRS
jgi:hypothetical protein